MKYELERAEAMEELENQELQQNMEQTPPKLESVEKKQEMPPKLERGSTLGESQDAFIKRKALEASTNKIQAEHRARDYAKQLVEDERKKQEYREKLYGK